MPNTYLYVDTEGPIRTWVRSLDTVSALVPDPSCFFGFPGGRALPVITMALIGDGVGGDNPAEDADISFAVWADTKALAADITVALKSAIRSLTLQTVEGLRLISGEVLNSFFQPDTSTDPDTPRYIVDARFVCCAV